MKIISILQWAGSHKAIALCYAGTSAALTNKVDETDIDAGSMAYLGNGDVYVFNGTQWNKVGD